MAFDDFYDPPPAAPEPPAPPVAAEPAAWSAPVGRPVPAQRFQVQPQASPTAQRAKAGLGIIVAAAGACAGAAFGGPLGCVAGLAGVGALRNLYRAQGIASSDPVEQGNAAKSLAICLVGGAIAGYLGYKAFAKDKS